MRADEQPRGDRVGRGMRGVNIYWQDFGESTAVDHRTAIGGLWEEMGVLQFEYLKSRGLRPEHRLLDVGCGSLRGGVHFVRYLEPGNYFGLDVNQSLLDAGTRELEQNGLADRQAHLLADPGFRFHRFGVRFEHAVAVSVFTHLFANQISRCFAEVARVLTPDGVFHFTHFEAPRSGHAEPIAHQPGGITTHVDSDPFHYSQDELRQLAAPHGLRVEFPGDWGHPRAQRMATASPAP